MARTYALLADLILIEGSFVQHWLHRAMFFEASESTFTILYILFFAAVALSLWLVKPRWPVYARRAQTRS